MRKRECVRFDIPEKEGVNQDNVKKACEYSLIYEDAHPYFRGALFQKDVSDENLLPERGLFTLPIQFINSLYNYAAQNNVAPHLGLEHFLTKAVNAMDILRFLPQRKKSHDNQSRRLHRVITWMCGGSKSKAREIIEENSTKLNEMVQEAIRLGKEYRKAS